MLSDAPITTTIRVTNLDEARKFYVDTLGLKVIRDETAEEGLHLEAGKGTKLYIYAGAPAPAQHTLASFTVSDIEKVVDDLTAKGVNFEHYGEGPMKTDDKGIASFGEMKAAWFKDPDGHFLSLDQY